MIDYELKYKRLEEKVRAMLQAQEVYFKTKKDSPDKNRKFLTWAGYQSRVNELMETKKEKTLFDVGQ